MSKDLLDRKAREIEQCERAIQAQAPDRAIRHAAEIARISFALARQTEGPVQQSHLGDAEGWIEIGEKLKAKPGSSGGGGAKATAAKPSSAGGGKSAVPAGDGDDDSEWKPETRPDVNWDDIAGMQDAKNTIREMVVYPLQQPEKAKALGLNPGGGVLLFGPPGNGKTLLGKAIATELDCPFYYASGAKIRSKWSGEAEKRLSALIKTAQAEPVAVLFFDEIEALLPKRGSASVVDNRLVTQFLADVGGFEDSDNTLLILGATNKPWDIDEAVFRTGRFDEKIHIAPPDLPARRGILGMALGQAVVDEAIDLDALAERLDGYSGSDIAGIVNAAKRQALRRSIQEERDPVILGDDLEAGLAAIPSSITDKMLKQYDKFVQTRFA